MKQALVIIDVQKDYFLGGKLELVGSDLALEKINLLEDAFLARQWPIIYIQHIKPDPKANFFAMGTTGADLHEGLRVQEDSRVIVKHFPNSFLQTELLSALTGLGAERLVIAGMMTQMCVDSTTRAARELGFQPLVISDATATRDLKFNNQEVSAANVQLSFLSALETFAEIKTTKEFLQEL
ncbi:MAG: cysteine hydrolase [Streptococcaceae bacterium]|jgi:nicotinamidase-related amidase|nr:cysteine hydrolase [Streptococcaceae bacterium]